MTPDRVQFHIDKSIKEKLQCGCRWDFIVEDLRDKVKRYKKRDGFIHVSERYLLNNWDRIEWKKRMTTMIVIQSMRRIKDIDWIKKSGCNTKIQAFDIEPKSENIKERDTLLNPPDYKDSWIITNPPYLARNKSINKEVFDMYETNDLYKCFITSVVKQNNCKGGIFIIPAGFFFSPRDIDVRCRGAFMKKYKITKVKYFEESVFDDTKTTIVAFSFEKSNAELQEQIVEWVMMPSNIKKEFIMSSFNDWIIGGDIYNLPVPEKISMRRHVEGQELRDNEQQLHITLKALDSGTKDGRISLSYRKDYVYPAKDCSRT